MTVEKELIAKYDIPAPRYTSYPTVPYWSENPTTEEWLDKVRSRLRSEKSSLSLYLHIPFCETLCSFCGCNTSITKNHTVEDPYVETILSEYSNYIMQVPEISRRELKELHLGGGTPTYLSEGNLEILLRSILERMNVSSRPEFSLEVDPRRTRDTQLKILHDFGFRRISLGVQDFDPEVQRLVNRTQPFEMTERITELSRKLGYTSVNFDLIYGLPKQNPESMKRTVKKTLELRPDRIAFYSYAHVPWLKAAQRLFTESDLPSGPEKRELYEISREMFLKAGYLEIGMDHFALESDSLSQAVKNGNLHRNFMGYTSKTTDMLLGLGVSAISDSWDCFHQNEKIVKKYQKRIHGDGFATLRGHKLDEEDLIQRSLILQLSTTGTVIIPKRILQDVKLYLASMEDDTLIRWEGNLLSLTEKGRPFLRNVCTGLDLRLRRKSPELRVFSRSI
ncbi:oxygen-independent coproporphyrinogen III oxidase [Leptospira santarosai]|uniref:Coproporphyrinogen-III oxidase n=1 Tax=Leptospira santarosai serovar Arenal str. MAVJ 401 TaxID=1049976 RepID=M6K3D8_9LEPT|nr:oxygen-independent coproporphyrinogen III oxidase [Leptospira santarosai]AVV51994.1 Coproporphyrinogen-III oxidase [Leptospira santarosai]EMN22282.1 coproporphyrinogen dehydrogenase [Leptospira santarosai serovar Arenal str. MAVJ 401]MBW9233202.1 oxygen-independent coproporphyrinogen III oxidase [Leptospira santarosai]OLY64204.1 oxygen-independent coproporphyrinogen III oxidase [Leptospira santarosai serovar Grippotyphosa]ONF78075.1 oxygen-independent coproporphyrinogen III oxidase [Leptosp